MIGIAEIKDRLSFDEMMGFSVQDNKNYNCLFHEEENPSMSIYNNKEKYHCHACGAGGDKLDMYAHINGLTLKEAINTLSMSHAKEFFEHIKNNEGGKEYLESRGIRYVDVKKFVGFDGGGITLPIRGPDLKVVGIQKRYLGEKKFKIDGESGFFYNAKGQSDDLFVTEGVFDYLTMRQNTEHVLGLLSSSKLPDVSKVLKRYKNIYWLGDQDDPGTKLKEKFMEKYSAWAFYELFDLEKGEDVNTVFGQMNKGKINKKDFIAWVKASCERIKNKSITTASCHMDSIVEKLQRKHDFTWGTVGMDLNLPLFRRGQYCVFVGESGGGKTETSFFIARKNAENGRRVLYITLEMSPANMLKRWSKRRAGITKREELKGQVPEEKVEKAKSFIDRLSEGVEFYGKENMTLKEADLVIEQGGYDMVFIDNLGFIEQAGDENQRYEQISEDLAEMRDRHNCCIVAIHHFRKSQPGKRTNSDIRGSKRIEDYADMIFYYIRDDQDPRYGKIIATKDREDGDTGAARLMFKEGEFIDVE